MEEPKKAGEILRLLPLLPFLELIYISHLSANNRRGGETLVRKKSNEPLPFAVKRGPDRRLIPRIGHIRPNLPPVVKKQVVL